MRAYCARAVLLRIPAVRKKRLQRNSRVATGDNNQRSYHPARAQNNPYTVGGQGSYRKCALCVHFAGRIVMALLSALLVQAQ